MPVASFVATDTACGRHPVSASAGGAPLFSGSHPCASACCRRMRRHDKVAVRTDGGRRAAEKSLPLHPDLLLLRARRPEAAAHEKKLPEKGAFCVQQQKRTRRGQGHVVHRRNGWGRAGQRNLVRLRRRPACALRRPLPFACPIPVGAGNPSPHGSGGDLSERPEEKFSEGRRGRGKGAPFSKEPFPPPAITGPATTAGPAKLLVHFQIGGGLRALFADTDAVDAHMTGARIGGQTAGHVLEDVAGDVL